MRWAEIPCRPSLIATSSHAEDRKATLAIIAGCYVLGRDDELGPQAHSACMLLANSQTARKSTDAPESPADGQKGWSTFRPKAPKNYPGATLIEPA